MAFARVRPRRQGQEAALLPGPSGPMTTLLAPNRHINSTKAAFTVGQRHAEWGSGEGKPPQPGSVGWAHRLEPTSLPTPGLLAAGTPVCGTRGPLQVSTCDPDGSQGPHPRAE